MKKITMNNDFFIHTYHLQKTTRNIAYAILFLGCALFIVYCNSFNGEWHFDDIDNILGNTNIRIQSFTLNNVNNILHGLNRDYWDRPLSFLSFALNYYYGKYDVFGYHLVNIIIHYLSSIFLFLFIYKILNLPLLKNHYGNHSYSIAILSTFLWALNPIHVSTVSYIVQRMACMVGLFYIASMYFYLLARTAENRVQTITYFCLCILASIFALGTKENAAMLPFTLFLFDLILIQGVTTKTLKSNLLPAVLIASTVIVIGLAYRGFSSPVGTYDGIRPFTMMQRVLTQPRVILLYISLLLYPANFRLMLLHDVHYSTSLFDPWSTLPAIIVLAIIALYTLYSVIKRPLIAFCIIFFLVNHLIEGSFLSLELIYEHRNYLPSMLLFVPISIFILRVVDYFSYRKPFQFIVATVVIMILFFFGDSTYTRNNVFQTERSLWFDNAEKAPYITRVLNNLGRAYWNAGDYEDAFYQYAIALKYGRDSNLKQKAIVYYNIGLYYLEISKLPDIAITYLDKAISKYPENQNFHSVLAKAYIMKGDLSQAETIIKYSLEAFPNTIEFHHQLSFILLKRGHYDEAIRHANTVIQKDPLFSEAYTVLGESYRKKQEWSKAILYWKRYDVLRPGSLRVQLSLIELYHLTKRSRDLSLAVSTFICLKGNRTIDEAVSETAREPEQKAYVPEVNLLINIIRNSLISS